MADNPKRELPAASMVRHGDVSALRPDGTCYHCRQTLGEPHSGDCAWAGPLFILEVRILLPVPGPAELAESVEPSDGDAIDKMNALLEDRCFDSLLDEARDRLGGVCLCVCSRGSVVARIKKPRSFWRATLKTILCSWNRAWPLPWSGTNGPNEKKHKPDLPGGN